MTALRIALLIVALIVLVPVAVAGGFIVYANATASHSHVPHH